MALAPSLVLTLPLSALQCPGTRTRTGRQRGQRPARLMALLLLPSLPWAAPERLRRHPQAPVPPQPGQPCLPWMLCPPGKLCLGPRGGDRSQLGHCWGCLRGGRGCPSSWWRCWCSAEQGADAGDPVPPAWHCCLSAQDALGSGLCPLGVWGTKWWHFCAKQPLSICAHGAAEPSALTGLLTGAVRG